MRHAAVTKRGSTGAVADNHRVLGASDLLIVQGDALHQLGRIDALLVTNANQVMECQSGQRDDRRAVKRGVIETIQEMDGAWTCRSHANAEPSGVLGKAGGHKGCGFLMAHADIANLS